jgi:hypothetical protein
MLHLPETLNKFQCPLIGIFKMSQALYESKSGFTEPSATPPPTYIYGAHIVLLEIKSTMITHWHIMNYFGLEFE